MKLQRLRARFTSRRLLREQLACARRELAIGRAQWVSDAMAYGQQADELRAGYREIDRLRFIVARDTPVGGNVYGCHERD